MTRYPILGVLLIAIGLWITALSWPVSEASHAIAAEIDRLRPKKAEAWNVAGGALQAGAEGWKFAAGRQDNAFVQCLQILIAVISVVWCCCVSIVTWIAINAIEPIGNTLGIAASYSVITLAIFLAGFGITHIATGMGLMLGWSMARIVARLIYFIDSAQGIFYLVASGPLWISAGPTFGGIALGVGFVLTVICVVAFRCLSRPDANADIISPRS